MFRLSVAVATQLPLDTELPPDVGGVPQLEELVPAVDQAHLPSHVAALVFVQSHVQESADPLTLE